VKGKEEGKVGATSQVNPNRIYIVAKPGKHAEIMTVTQPGLSAKYGHSTYCRSTCLLD
jgi:hypothetical protein